MVETGQPMVHPCFFFSVEILVAFRICGVKAEVEQCANLSGVKLVLFSKELSCCSCFLTVSDASNVVSLFGYITTTKSCNYAVAYSALNK